MTKALYSLHGWIGIVVGVLLFVVCLSGAAVVFKHEIDMWANPALRAGLPKATPVGLDAVAAAVQRPGVGLSVDSIGLPDATTPVYIVSGRDGANVRRKLALHPGTGEVLGPVESELGQFLRLIHVFFLVGPRTIVGLLGVVMLALLVTGVLIHKKMRQELFSLRWHRSLRLTLIDGHKTIGVWLLLFNFLIALSGAWLGLKPVVMSAATHLAGTAHSPAPAAAKAGAAARKTAPMLSLDALLSRAKSDLPGLEVRNVFLRHWGFADAEVSFYGVLGDHGVTEASLSYCGVDGSIVKLTDPRSKGFWAQFDSLQRPLHFGNFGGLTLKWLYFLLGLGLATLSISGAWLWIDRQRRQAVECAS